MLGSDSFYAGQADVFAVFLPGARRQCTERVSAFAEMLRHARTDGLFLEIAVPTVARCILGDAITSWNLELAWDAAIRSNSSRLAQRFVARARNESFQGVFHPLKLSASDSVAAAAALRDMSWSKNV